MRSIIILFALVGVWGCTSPWPATVPVNDDCKNIVCQEDTTCEQYSNYCNSVNGKTSTCGQDSFCICYTRPPPCVSNGRICDDTKKCCDGYCHQRKGSDTKSCQSIAFIGEDCSSGISCDRGSQCINNKCSLRKGSECKNVDNVCPSGASCKFGSYGGGGDYICMCDGDINDC